MIPTPFAAFEPRFVIICAAMLSCVAAFLTQICASLAALCAGILLLFLSRQNFRVVINRLLAVNVFIAFIWLITPFTTPGPLLWHWHFISMSQQGINLSILVTIKANALGCIFLALLAPMPVTDLGSGLYNLKCPEKLIWLFLLMGRNIHILKAEWQNLMEAARLRGFIMKNSLWTYRTIASLLAILLVRAHNRGLRVHEAMLLRGFTGKLPYYGAKPATGRDYFLLAATTAFSAILIIMETLPANA